MTEFKEVRAPGGTPPPVRAGLPDGSELDLVALAGEVADRHLARFPADAERYGARAREWCMHDVQHLLNWAALDVAGLTSMDREVAWLARVLDARGYPVEHLRGCLEITADVVRPASAATADVVRAAADGLGTPAP